MRKIPKTEVRTDWLLVDLSPLLTQSSTFCGKKCRKKWPKWSYEPMFRPILLQNDDDSAERSIYVH
jgi:hypothetical protein